MLILDGMGANSRSESKEKLLLGGKKSGFDSEKRAVNVKRNILANNPELDTNDEASQKISAGESHR